MNKVGVDGTRLVCEADEGRALANIFVVFAVVDNDHRDDDDGWSLFAEEVGIIIDSSWI